MLLLNTIALVSNPLSASVVHKYIPVGSATTLSRVSTTTELQRLAIIERSLSSSTLSKVTQKPWRRHSVGLNLRARYMTGISAVDKDPLLKSASWEWQHVFITVDGDDTTITCCPEDVKRCDLTQHAAHGICGKCAVPLCHSCHMFFHKRPTYIWRSATTSTLDTYQ